MIESHAVIIFASYAAFLAAVVSGLLFLVQERRLKRKDPRVLRASVIPLELLDRVNLFSVVAGFLLFSFGMAQGMLLSRREWGSYLTRDPKELASFLTWAAYAAVMGLRLKLGLRGRRVVFVSIVSFGLVLFTFVGVNYWLGGKHVFF